MSEVNIFKAYDVRGIYPSELNEEVAYKIARAYATMRQQEVGSEKITVVLGQDMRLSSPALADSIKNGLIDQGVKVIEIGLVSAPAFYFSIHFLSADGGLLISASHNPKEYNGVKIVRDKARPFGAGTGMEELKQLVEENSFISPSSKGDSIEHSGIVEEHVKYEEKDFDLGKIKKFKIVADTANSMGAQYLDKLFSDLPQIEFVKMNFELDGTFPVHQADPLQDKNIVDLKKRVLQEGADLGIATDGDGDRIFFIGNDGNVVEPAILRGILARLFLRDNPKSVICYDIRPGKITKDIILENGGTPLVTRVGHSLIKQQMIEAGAVFGGESSGHFFVKSEHGVYEAPVIIILKLLKELADVDQSLSEYVKPFYKYFHSGEINFIVDDKEFAFKKIREKYGDAEINDLDGLTFTYDNFWFNVRASNTESLLRLNLEATTKEVMQEKVKEVQSIIEG